ncbi:MAG: thiamine pyrophosphate-binding protein [Cyanobacteriota/Melainabacteria group bacterium]
MVSPAGRNDADFKLSSGTSHENTAIAMTSMAIIFTGRTQVVMGHVNVGTANMGLGIINASRSHIPVLVLRAILP